MDEEEDGALVNDFINDYRGFEIKTPTGKRYGISNNMVIHYSAHSFGHKFPGSVKLFEIIYPSETGVLNFT